jgi:hypothetical protein
MITRLPHIFLSFSSPPSRPPSVHYTHIQDTLHNLHSKPKLSSSGVPANRTPTLCANSQHVLAAQRILDEARVELDRLLDGVVVLDAEVQRLLDDEERDALCARGCGQRAAVLQDVGRLHARHCLAEVDAGGDLDF